jgi:hypothetical protein
MTDSRESENESLGLPGPQVRFSALDLTGRIYRFFPSTMLISVPVGTIRVRIFAISLEE